MATYSNPAELARGLCFDLDLRDLRGIQELGGAVTGALQYRRNNGAVFDGVNDYIVFPARAQPFSSGFYGCTIDFTPSTMLNDGLRRYFFHSVGSAACSIIKLNADDSLRLRHNGIDYVVSAYATWSQYLRLNVKNTITATVGTGGTKLYLNGVLLGSSGAVTTSIVTTGLNIGASDTGTEKFLGSISSVKFFRHNSAAELLTAQEASDFYLNRTYNYAKRAACILPMQMSNHEPNHALQVSEVDQTQLCADGDMEAVGTAAWTVGGAGAVVQKAAGARPGGTGTQVLQIIRAGAQATASQTILTIGQRYRITGWARGDGAASWPRVGTGAVFLWSGTTSATWQYFDLVFTASHAAFMLFNGVSDGICEFDDFSVKAPVSLLSDGAMEQFDTDQWTPGNNAALTKSTALPYEGTRCLQVAFGGSGNPYAGQTILTIGKQYSVSGWARGDGVSAAFPMVAHAVTVLWSGTTSATWQYFSVTFTATSTSFRLYCNAAAPGNCCFDACVVVPMAARTLDTSGRGQSFTLGDGTTVVTFPTKAATRGYNLSGNNQYFLNTSISLSGATKFTISMMFKAAAVPINYAMYMEWKIDANNAVRIYGGDPGTTDRVGVAMQVAGVANTARALASAFAVGTYSMCTVVYDSTLVAANRITIYRNGVSLPLTLGGTLPTSVPVGYAPFMLGWNSFPAANGLFAYVQYSNFAFTPTQVIDEYLQVMQQIQAT